ncbi:MAG: hypothetical protein M3007_04235 [Candidatus Eremiobacteraeota bacterium]|nr:hypothetical protein [Candidatus Eremiobacteraeota bacterium]
MPLFFAALAAVIVIASPLPPATDLIAKRSHPPYALGKERTRTEERAMRRRVVRLARIIMLERRQAQLKEFLLDAMSERVALRDSRVVTLEGGLQNRCAEREL